MHERKIAFSRFSVLQATESWAGPGNEAITFTHDPKYRGSGNFFNRKTFPIYMFVCCLCLFVLFAFVYLCLFVCVCVCCDNFWSSKAYRCGMSYALVTLGTISVYALLTLGVTQWRCVCVCVHACVRAGVCVCVRACMYTCSHIAFVSHY